MRTAAVKSGLVIDIEESNDPSALTPRSDGAIRVICPSWVDIGDTHTGTRFLPKDGKVVPLIPKTKLQLRKAMTDAEWGGFNGAIASLASSEDPSARRIAEEYALATEIDPNDLSTRAAITMLVAAGLFTQDRVESMFEP